jgi:hypothetical protein
MAFLWRRKKKEKRRKGIFEGASGKLRRARVRKELEKKGYRKPPKKKKRGR